MKIKSLKSAIVLFVLMLLQTSCNPQNSINIEEKRNEVKALVKRAKFLRHEGDIDSAISYYKKGIPICYTLMKAGDTIKDTVYNREISKLNAEIGSLYDSLNRLDSAMKYFTESIKWGKLSNTPKMIIGVAGEIGYMYYIAGNKCAQGSSEQKKLYSTGVKYLVSSCRTMDSVGVHKNNLKFETYTAIEDMYIELGDSAHAQFYRNRCMELENQLYKGNQ